MAARMPAGDTPLSASRSSIAGNPRRVRVAVRAKELVRPADHPPRLGCPPSFARTWDRGTARRRCARWRTAAPTRARRSSRCGCPGTPERRRPRRWARGRTPRWPRPPRRCRRPRARSARTATTPRRRTTLRDGAASRPRRYHRRAKTVTALTPAAACGPPGRCAAARPCPSPSAARPRRRSSRGRARPPRPGSSGCARGPRPRRCGPSSRSGRR